MEGGQLGPQTSLKTSPQLFSLLESPNQRCSFSEEIALFVQTNQTLHTTLIGIDTEVTALGRVLPNIVPLLQSNTATLYTSLSYSQI